MSLFPPPGDTAALERGEALTPRFGPDGLVAAVATHADTGEVLMLAWMNPESVAEKLRTGRVCYWSRSRAALWRKGETSGQVQRLVELRLDCDGDALLLLVDQYGVACHTGHRSCFYQAMRGGETVEVAPALVSKAVLYGTPGPQKPGEQGRGSALDPPGTVPPDPRT